MEAITKITIVDTEKQAVWGRPTGRNYVRPTQTERAHIALNCYEPGVNDELHCHPGSDTTYPVACQSRSRVNPPTAVERFVSRS